MFIDRITQFFSWLPSFAIFIHKLDWKYRIYVNRFNFKWSSEKLFFLSRNYHIINHYYSRYDFRNDFCITFFFFFLFGLLGDKISSS